MFTRVIREAILYTEPLPQLEVRVQSTQPGHDVPALQSGGEKVLLELHVIIPGPVQQVGDEAVRLPVVDTLLKHLKRFDFFMFLELVMTLATTFGTLLHLFLCVLGV